MFENGTISYFIYESPSHTVGLEHLEVLRITYKLTKSPSHPVGLERVDMEFINWRDYVSVTIPPSGLRTPNDHIN